MSTIQIEDILKKIQKLLALAGNNPSVEEAAAASARAQQMMDDHHLSMSDLDSAALNQADPMGRSEVKDEFEPAMARWKTSFVARLARLHDCRCYVQTPRYGQRLKQIMLIGRETDRQVIGYLATFLIREIESLAHFDFKWNNQGLGNSGRRNWVENFAGAACEVIIVRMTTEKQTFQATVAGNAVTISRDGAVDLYMRQIGLHLSAGRSYRSDVNSEARANGREAGKAVAWRSGVGANGRKAVRLSA
jgi:Protein of unknown function (DUF2786)